MFYIERRGGRDLPRWTWGLEPARQPPERLMLVLRSSLRFGERALRAIRAAEADHSAGVDDGNCCFHDSYDEKLPYTHYLLSHSQSRSSNEQIRFAG